MGRANMADSERGVQRRSCGGRGFGEQVCVYVAAVQSSGCEDGRRRAPSATASGCRNPPAIPTACWMLPVMPCRGNQPLPAAPGLLPGSCRTHQDLQQEPCAEHECKHEYTAAKQGCCTGCQASVQAKFRHCTPPEWSRCWRWVRCFEPRTQPCAHSHCTQGVKQGKKQGVCSEM